MGHFPAFLCLFPSPWFCPVPYSSTRSRALSKRSQPPETDYADYLELPPEGPELDLLRAARAIYEAYCVIMVDRAWRPYGIVVNRHTFRGRPIFQDRVILLPDERFISIRQIELQMY